MASCLMRDGGSMYHEAQEGELSLDGRSFKALNEDLFAVLLDRTEGEMRRRVINQGTRAAAGQRNYGGVKAYLAVYLWCMDTTGFQMSERGAYIMVPMQATGEEDVADAVEAWEREGM